MNEERKLTKKILVVALYVAIYFGIIIATNIVLSNIDEVNNWKVALYYLMAALILVIINYFLYYKMKAYPFFISVILLFAVVPFKFLYMATYNLNNHSAIENIRMYLKSSEMNSMYFLLYLLFLDVVISILFIKNTPFSERRI
jgi:glucan phosphoethanolaminetransferase (alkaline phosphatase superfamily)